MARKSMCRSGKASRFAARPRSSGQPGSSGSGRETKSAAKKSNTTATATPSTFGENEPRRKLLTWFVQAAQNHNQSHITNRHKVMPNVWKNALSACQPATGRTLWHSLALQGGGAEEQALLALVPSRKELLIPCQDSGWTVLHYAVAHGHWPAEGGTTNAARRPLHSPQSGYGYSR